MLVCGLRLSEVLGLGWDSVELEGPVPKLQVRRGLKRITGRGLVLEDVKTKKSRRTVHLTPTAVKAFRDHLRRTREARLAAGSPWPDTVDGVDLVFRSPVGSAMDPKALWTSLSAATRAAGASWERDPESRGSDGVRIVAGTGLGHWHPHELRHSAASLLIAHGVPLKLVSEMLGHSSISITADIYSHLLDDSRAEVAAAMAAITG